MKNINIKIKVVIILIFSFIVTKAISNNIFLANSPRLNQQFLLSLKNLPLTLVSSTRNFIASLNQKQTSITDTQKTTLQRFKQLPTTGLNQLSKGVYAEIDSQEKIVYIRVTGDAEWEERIVNYEGKRIKVRFPKGTFK